MDHNGVGAATGHVVKKEKKIEGVERVRMRSFETGPMILCGLQDVFRVSSRCEYLMLFEECFGKPERASGRRHNFFFIYNDSLPPKLFEIDLREVPITITK